jgi:alpha-galactosidase
MPLNRINPWIRAMACVLLASPALTVLAGKAEIVAETDHAAIAWRVEGDGTLNQRHFGSKPVTGNAGGVAYPAAGYDYVTEPALRAVHADGNASTDLAYVRHEITHPADGVTLTRIELKDRIYPFFVTLFCRSHEKTDIFEFWTEIRHEEPGIVMLYNFASAAPVIPQKLSTLSHFHGIWGWGEADLEREKLIKGTKILDSKLGSRAQAECSPMFLLSGETPQEEAGEVIGGTLAWSGNFQFAFEQATPRNSRSEMALRAICGMNPFASQYRLEPRQSFTTPALILGYSAAGLGPMSRNFHRWARKNALRDGDKPRAILLNNWEATYFNFDEKKLVGLFDGAKAAGMELFLLDDGWFGDKFPRNDDRAGLGDWMSNPKKLPHGVEALAQEAIKRGVRFGIWVEPEMVNPRSELFQKHPEWALTIPGRAQKTHRNQLVLDLCNPAVEDYAFKCMDDLLTNAPGISYVKWDCNSHMAMPFSPSLGALNQSHLYIEYTRALYRIMDRLAKKHPAVEMMACSAGGGRVDYGSLPYFHEFWPSDITDPIRRIEIQHHFSYIFPAIAQSDHVTHMGHRPLKFAFDVAMSGRLGMDMDLQQLSPADRATCATGITAYKTIRDIVQLGDQYRLENAHENRIREAIAYVSEDKARAVLMVYQTAEAKTTAPVKLNGLDPAKNYRLKEINLPAGGVSSLGEDGKVVSGQVLMEKGLMPPCQKAISSAIITMTAE